MMRSRWAKDFVKVDDETLFNLILAANYLDIKSLLDLTCKTVADEICKRPRRFACGSTSRTTSLQRKKKK